MQDYHMGKLLTFITVFFAVGVVSTHAQTSSSYKINGVVRDDKNQSVSGVQVCAFPPNIRPEQNVTCRLSDEEGKFTMVLGAGGIYTLIPGKSRDGYWPQRVPYFKDPVAKLNEVVLNEDNKSAFAIIYLGPKNGIIIGRSVDENTNLPVESVYFLMCHADRPRVCWGTSAKNDKGEFRIPAAHVPFTLRASAEGYEDWVGLSGADRPDAGITVPPGTTTQLSIRMRRRADTTTRPLSEAEKQEGVNLPAPKQLSPADGMKFEHNAFPRETKLEWSPVEGAATYMVEVDFCDGRQKGTLECRNPQPMLLSDNPPMTNLTGTSYEFKFIGAQPGRWRVWAIDKEGHEGFKSAWRTFVYFN